MLLITIADKLVLPNPSVYLDPLDKQRDINRIENYRSKTTCVPSR